MTPPADVVSDTDRFLEPRRIATEKSPWRWSQPTTYHLTLAFIADHPGCRVGELIQAPDEWVRHRVPLAMSIAGAGGFRGPERAEVLYPGVPGTATVQLGEWSRQLRAFVTHYGGSPDGTGFRTHVTIARVQRARSAGRLLQVLDAYESREFIVDEIVLVESRLVNRTHGMLHRAILRGRAAIRQVCTSVHVRMYISAMVKRTKDPEGHRKKILQAAGELIEEIGISAVAHRRVAERARVPLGLTTQYFKFLIDMLTEALAGLEEGHEGKLAELNEVDDPVDLVADVVMESLAGLKRTRDEMSFTLLYTTHPKLRRFIVPGGAALVERSPQNIPEVTGRTVFAYCYGALLQAVVQDTVASRGEAEEMLRRLIGDSTERGDLRKTRVPRSVGALERGIPGRAVIAAALA